MVREKKGEHEAEHRERIAVALDHGRKRRVPKVFVGPELEVAKQRLDVLHARVREPVAAEGVGGIRCVKGKIASGDCFVNSAEKKKYISETFGALACEMEGAAIGQVCYVNRVPFCVIRAISDAADGSSFMDYSNFIALAAKNSAAVLTELLRSGN